MDAADMFLKLGFTNSTEITVCVSTLEWTVS